AVLGASALLAGDGLPGVWLVLTGWHPEVVPGDGGPAATCAAVALGLVGPRLGGKGWHLRVLPKPVPEAKEPLAAPPGCPLFSLEALLPVVSAPRSGPVTVVWRLNRGGWVELEHTEGSP